LRDALTDAFVNAVSYFNSSGGPMKYTWPIYIPSTKQQSFFHATRKSILERLKGTKILESGAQVDERFMLAPASLLYVDPERYADREGNPFTSKGLGDLRYLSSHYPKHTIETLYALGVRKMSDDMFLTDLEWIITNELEAFHARSVEWHSLLAKALLPLIDRREFTKRLRRLPVIPLIDGSWTSADSESPPFFQQDSMIAALEGDPPSGISIVHQSAVIDYSRKSLLTRLGVEMLSVARMCKHICDIHASKDAKPGQWTTEQLVSHVKFLYEADWSPPDGGADLWFATASGARSKGSLCYLPRSCEDIAYQKNHG
jgi:hypothetical protein